MGQGDSDLPMSQKKKKHTGIILGVLAVGMLGMAYASVPLYRIFCQKTGYGGTTQVAPTLPDVITNRLVTVRFNADVNRDLPWEFKPLQKEVTVRAGEQGFALYRAKNKTDKAIYGMSTYNVTPDKAGVYFNKVECFCFIEQKLEAHQEVDMPVLFFIDPEIENDPKMKDVKSITLSYTFFRLR
ncbi:MAG: cytochrome c oxidase assembly protein [Alphaproteobacteria bacterium]|jgi:cytochrome c oxidase assembly protein subunit 11|nr:cytochrome c oxidase assembly protein [Alphaproteobacteria bacterium]MBT5389401.1 cytochrome c oxidase assembly protein [Alphaproteobacteria bacterium]MBT5540850.1 cytochrome c oxidase assembly protein [Alphaproteobacteria bacterium]MBT5654672.1 cytochrome c oxidase assembly protein [Alphaproteobacteria bacterium]